MAEGARESGSSLYQLQMIWPPEISGCSLDSRLQLGYRLRLYRPGDEPRFHRLMALAGFAGWNDDRLLFWQRKILPSGWFFVFDIATGDIVATSMAMHNPVWLHPFGGELGWVAGHPAHRGRALGYAVCAAAIRRFLAAGYERIYLKTDDWRLPAISTYLKLGFVPFLFASDMEARWQNICKALDFPFTPKAWQTLQEKEG